MLKVQEIRELIKLIDQSTIDEFTYETNGTTVTMKKSTATKVSEPQLTEIIEKSQAIETENKPNAVVEVEKNIQTAENAQEQVQAQVNYDAEIVSPMVGTFYRAPNPESDPFVSVGTSVSSETTVCIVEAMKLFNEIEAEVSGEIVEILVKDGELVEYGQPLFRVKSM
ncbi:acetyl-CoA carboxylase biotin carboxyl carrier protein [Virgibacillus soli]|uniref:Biotin carboxyl carrier protein of acetyl-CoA carboxylase n=1 Tax=Paracerasibacillus soli TaxID=480284 RepID=A0ABU5CSJ5_9BACI|nr:acetyl-CoA carboxylase biotin carboxyl carrier protein [Virgibacillus soli]MDY0408400.1 acetyl-CoA carboxylase biotin carboxyl carrier protein [Virgibacillus soli]